MTTPQQKLLQYDISRGRIPKVRTILDHADALQPHGLTGIVLYIECVVATRTFPAVGCGTTPVTADWLVALRDGLRARGLDLVPLVQILGHQEQLLAREEVCMHGETHHEPESFRIDSTDTRRAIQRWLDEIIGHFDYPTVHVGCDEASKVGIGRSAWFLEKHGFEGAMADFLNDFAGHLRQRGRTMAMFADALIHYPRLADMLDHDIVICNWGYGTWDEVYERDNRHFERHLAVTAGRRNWAFGNCMAEYILPPAPRLQANTEIWLDLCARSQAEAFVISDWGSYDNVNPYASTLFGALFILIRLTDPRYNVEHWLNDISHWVLGCIDERLVRSLRLLTSAQTNPDYFGERLTAWSPLLPTLMLGHPDTRSVHRLCAVFDRAGLDAFERDAREVFTQLEELPASQAAQPELLSSIHGLGRRMLLLALRTRLCYEHTWDTGAIWISHDDMRASQERLLEYKTLAEHDLQWTMSEWDRHCLESCRERARNTLLHAASSVADVSRAPDNSLFYFPPTDANRNAGDV